MKIVQINVSANRGSTGKIAEGIGKLVLAEGWQSYIAYGGSHRPSESELISIGGKWNTYNHALQSRLFDNHGLASKWATEIFVTQLDQIRPDIVHLHNIHDYYLNYPILFSYLKKSGIPVVWTLHDCWPFTGHCAYFDRIGCEKWKTECNKCPGLYTYPKSWMIDRSKRNYNLKKKVITELVERLTLVPVSKWIEGFLAESFLYKAQVKTIHNGININTFTVCGDNKMRERLGIHGKFVIVGVAAIWDERKGLKDFVELRERLSQEEYSIVLVGLTKKQSEQLPKGIIGITRTDSPEELAQVYSMADVFFNPTYEDNYPTTNLEAIACGTPVIAYDTGGCKEAVTEDVGWIVQQGKIAETIDIIKGMKHHILTKSQSDCREYAIKFFDEEKAFAQYVEIYQDLKVGGVIFNVVCFSLERRAA